MRPSSICRTSHRLLKLSSPKQDLSDRVSTLAADGVAAPPACRFDAAVAKSMMEALLPAMFAVRCGTSAHSMDPDAFSSLKAFSTFRAHRHRCMLVLRRRRNCRNTAIALVADVTRAAGRQRNASLQTPLARTGAHQECADWTLRVHLTFAHRCVRRLMMPASLN